MIEYVNGNILDTDCNIICHQVNCFGVMGAGLAKQIKDKYPIVYEQYKKLCDTYDGYGRNHRSIRHQLLATVQYIQVEDNKWVFNLFSQYNYGRDRNYTDYTALRICLSSVEARIKCHKGMSVALPYGLGCGLAGGDWSEVYKIIQEVFEDSNVSCKIYHYEKEK